jgi:hypothetical protein
MPAPQRNRNTLEGASAADFLRALRDPGRNLKEQFKGKPLELADRFGLLLPRKPVDRMIELGVLTEEEAEAKFGKRHPGLREMIDDVCTLRVRDAAAVASRGGGKSYGVSFVEFYLWLVLDFDALNLGGSELQADNVYQYLIGYIESDPYWKTLLKTDPQREKTFSIEDSWVRVLTASSKSVRSPHAGGKRRGKTRGGLLVIDEEAEADKDIVDAALPTINTAMPSVNVRCSTFHNVAGSFAELIDNHEEMGYTLYRWDTFDVCAGCECVDVCQSPEPCFREDHVETITNTETGLPEEKMIHKAYCGGKAMYAEGWVPMEEIEKLWRRMRRNHARWEVEAMGQRPSTSGYVVLNMTRFNDSIVNTAADSLYVPNNPIDIDVDWGTGNGAVEVWQEQGRKQILLHADLLPENTRTDMFGSIIGYATRYRSDLVAVNCDIGGGGNYLNQELRDVHRLPVNDVNFSEVKETSAAAMNIYVDGSNLVIPAEHVEFIEQVRGWRRDQGGRIVKKNDHLCDAMICHFAGFIERLGLHKVAIPPRAFSSNPDLRGGTQGPPMGAKARAMASTGQGRGRVAIARGFGSKKKR